MLCHQVGKQVRLTRTNWPKTLDNFMTFDPCHMGEIFGDSTRMTVHEKSPIDDTCPCDECQMTPLMMMQVWLWISEKRTWTWIAASEQPTSWEILCL